MSRLCADFKCPACLTYFEYYYCDFEYRNVQKCPECNHTYIERVYTPWIVKPTFDKDGTYHRVIRRVTDNTTGKVTEENITEAVKAGKI